MSAIHEIIFFTHPNNVTCQYLDQFLTQYNIPVKKVRIQSKSIAQRVKKGKYFNIRGVPTFIVVTQDGNVQRYEGSDCKQWLELLIQGNTVTHEESEEELVLSSSDEELDSDDAEMLDEMAGGTKSMTMPSGKVDVQAMTQRAEQERAEMEEHAMKKRKRG